MRVADHLLRETGRPVISFEFSRPTDDKAASRLDKALGKLRALNPDYVSVTFGAGGSTRDGSLELVDKLKNEFGFEVVAYIAGVGMGTDQLVEVLDKFRSLGIQTVFTIRGDAPTWDDTYEPHPQALAHASDLIAFIKERYDFCLGTAGYPEGHKEAESKERDIECLKLKVHNGAEYIVAQYFYDNQYFFDFLDMCHAAQINVPIVPGIMPVYTVKLMESLARICGITITDEIHQGLAGLPPGDKKAVTDFGIRLAIRQCRGLLERGHNHLHFYTMNRANSVVSIIETLRGEGTL
ncbi:methylenetetrahydrofolate reductase [Candidatus Eisenbacteria bacterium]|uniref:Methylenetetrahydrofolate reductase n=1 Tax=Eiseniibacteriota bacterium TaxID=2212470 RepID=A0ABV6YKS0_UNCEI